MDSLASLGKEALGALRELAAKLGVTAEEAWRILIQQAAIEGYMDIFSAVISACIAVVIPFFCVRRIRAIISTSKERGFAADFDDYGGYIIIGGFLTIISVSLMLFFAQCAFTELYNPEYWALMKVRALLY